MSKITRITVLVSRIIVLLVLGARVAGANALDTFGFTAQAEGMAGAVTASATGHTAAFHNPAGVAASGDVEVAIGYGSAVPRLTIDGQDARITTPRGTTLGLSIPIRIGSSSVRVAFGIALYLPDQFLLRIQLIPAAEPHFVLLDNNVQHLVVTPVVALQPVPWLQLGIGASVLADAAGNGVTFDVGVVGGEKVGRGELDVSLPNRITPVAGLRVLPTHWLTVGLAYRGAIDLKLQLDVLARVNIAGAVKGDTLISLRAVNVFNPQRLTMGVAVSPHPSLTLEADLDWVNWSAFHGGVPDLRILLALGVTPSLVQALFPPGTERFRDVWVPRLGAQLRRAVGGHAVLTARAGYAYERSPVPDQTGLTSFADNDRHVVAVGGGLSLDRFTAVLERPLSLDVALQWHELVGRTTVKDPRYFPGAGYASGGRMVHLAATLTGRF